MKSKWLIGILYFFLLNNVSYVLVNPHIFSYSLQILIMTLTIKVNMGFKSYYNPFKCPFYLIQICTFYWHSYVNCWKDYYSKINSSIPLRAILIVPRDLTFASFITWEALRLCMSSSGHVSVINYRLHS